MLNFIIHFLFNILQAVFTKIHKHGAMLHVKQIHPCLHFTPISRNYGLGRTIKHINEKKNNINIKNIKEGAAHIEHKKLCHT